MFIVGKIIKEFFVNKYRSFKKIFSKYNIEETEKKLEKYKEIKFKPTIKQNIKPTQ